uniref:Phosphatidylinositol transfer protein beta isoform n=1 Tax=Cyprinus carpio TaxID=7962 RepID=A0A8C1Z310_CYPCA
MNKQTHLNLGWPESEDIFGKFSFLAELFFQVSEYFKLLFVIKPHFMNLNITVSSPQNEYMKDDFMIKIETWHKPDTGSLENVHDLDPTTWKMVEVVHIDIADRSQVEPGDYKQEEDPAIFQSEKTGRGPLGPDWKKELLAKPDAPRMCAYKLVTVKFKWWGLQTKIENFIHKQEKRIFTNFHRQLFCWIDSWVELTMEDIRRMEEETQRDSGSVCY